jgi:2-hydroxy-3-keto-5-methylthiopentenyl-1-phosphate phosphatase
LPKGERPILLYAGDGTSDLSAARETDLLFAKAGQGKQELVLPPPSQSSVADMITALALVTYCEREGVPFTLFENWSTILSTTKDIYEGKVSVGKVAEEGLNRLHKEGNKV